LLSGLPDLASLDCPCLSQLAWYWETKINEKAANEQHVLYNNQINARAQIGQSAMVYCAVNSWKFRLSSELLYESNRPQVSMV